MRLPRPCRLRVVRVGSFACQLGIGEALAADLGHEQSEAVVVIQQVVFGGPVVI